MMVLNIGSGFPLIPPNMPPPPKEQEKDPTEKFFQKMSGLGITFKEFEIEFRSDEIPEGILDLSFKLIGLDEKKIVKVLQVVKEMPIKRLILSNNYLESVPEEIINLECIQELVLSENKLTAVPEVLWQMEHLTYLNLSDNQISSLPESIVPMPNLASVVLSGNLLNSVPESLKDLIDLNS